MPDLKNAQIYIIVSPDIPAKNPNPHYVDETDVQQVAQWVSDGGVLLLMENDVGNSEFEHFNKLSEKFGIHFNPVTRNQVEGNKWEMGKIIIPAGTIGFTSPHTAYMKEISTISPQKPAQATLADKGDVLMAISKYGKGTVFAVVDPWLYNEYGDGIKLPPEYDNYAAGKQLVQWLLQQVPSEGKR